MKFPNNKKELALGVMKILAQANAFTVTRHKLVISGVSEYIPERFYMVINRFIKAIDQYDQTHKKPIIDGVPNYVTRFLFDCSKELKTYVFEACDHAGSQLTMVI